MTATARGSGASTAAEVRERVREAVTQRQPLRIVGGGTWLDANRPVVAATQLSTLALTGVVEYVPGDLTLTARAGTTLDEIARVTAAHDQWLALDPHGDGAHSTIGATIATGSYGPLAHHFGTPRDMVLGVEFVTGNGDIARGGGRVVKNVAGFDLTRLVTGSWGALGVITEVSVRLRARPALESTLAIDVGSDAAAIERTRGILRAMPFVPLAAQLLSARLARAADVGASTTLLLRIGGNEEAVKAQRRQLDRLGDVRSAPDATWTSLRGGEPRGAVVVRLSSVSSRFAVTWREGAELVETFAGYCHGDPGRGVVRCVVPAPTSDAAEPLSRALSTPGEPTRIFERLPDAWWGTVAPLATGDRLSRGIKRAFDPDRVLNPGILGDVA